MTLMVALESNTAYDADTGTLTDAYVLSVKGALPDNICVTDAFWRELTSIVTNYSMLRQNRARRPPAAEIKRWQRIALLATKLDAELPARSSDVLPDPMAYRRLAESQIAGYQALNEGFNRKRNLHDVTLHRWTLDLWHQGLGQPLGTSRDKNDGKISGPLVRFFVACTAPLLDKPLKVRGVAEIVTREKAGAIRRAKVTARARNTFLKPNNIS